MFPQAADGARCTLVGPLEAVVESLDDGPLSRSLHHLMGRLHAAAGDDDARMRWVESVRARFDAIEATAFEFDLADARVELAHCAPAHADGYREAIDAFRSVLASCGAGEAAAYRATGTTPEDAATLIHAVAVRCDGRRAVGISMVRAADVVGDAEATVQYLCAIAWHLKCADAANTRLKVLSLGLTPLDLVGILPMGCMLTDAAGRAIERNAAFSQFMEDASLRVQTGRLRFDDPYLQDSWQVALSEVGTTVVRQALLAGAPDGRQWLVHLLPLRCAIDPGDPTQRELILTVVEQRNPAEAQPNLDLSDTERALTPAESDVLNSLLQGHSAKVIANARGASVNTVRTQIMSILGKTGFHNQKSLMAAFSPSVFRSSTSSQGFPAAGSRSGTSQRR